MPASPSFSSAARACVRRATSARPPSPAWTLTASGSAQRCSNEWKPPGVISAPGGAPCGGRPSIHAPYTRGSKDGMVGASRRQACGAAQTNPVPRGPNSHLWQPEASRSMPRLGRDASSTPKPCTPSTHRRMRSRSRRPRLACATAAAISRSGSFTPLEECTHVSASARVRGPSARDTAETIPSTDADSGSSYRRTRRTVTPSSSSRSRSDSWVAKKSCSDVTISSPGRGSDART